MIELKKVWRSYGRKRMGLSYGNLTIPTGEIVGILGENGSGKTTLLKAIMGLGDIQEGEILIDGRPVGQQYERMAFITEESSFLPGMTPLQYADFLADFFPRFDRRRYQKLLEFFQLAPDLKIRTFSKGQKAKLEICAGFSKSADYLLMDEPFLGHDIFSRNDFLKIMISYLQGHETLLIATHLIEEIENVIDRAIILRRGRILADHYIEDIQQQGISLTEVVKQAAGYQEDHYKQFLE